MTTGIQFIEKHGKHEYAIVPFPLYQRMVEAMEDREDIEALERFHAEDDGFRITCSAASRPAIAQGMGAYLPAREPSSQDERVVTYSAV